MGRGVSKRKRARYAAKKAGFRSGFEQQIAKDLDERGIKYEFEPETFGYDVPIRNAHCADCKSRRVFRRSRYLIDFRLSNGRYVEAKGKLTAANRTRLGAFRRQQGAPAVSILFQADNWLTKLHRQRYSDWARKEGFDFHVGKTIPEEWTA